MALFIEKPLAFVWKDFIHEASYKLAFFMQVFGILITTVTFFYLSKLLGDVGTSYLKPYGGDYFSFVLIGVAFFNYLKVSMDGLSASIREGQMVGTLEALLVTQTEIPAIILSSSLYSFIFASFKVAVFLILGAFFFGVDMGNANIAGALLILLLTIISFSSIGIISASFVMVLKKGKSGKLALYQRLRHFGRIVLSRLCPTEVASKIVRRAAGYLFPRRHETRSAQGEFFKRTPAKHRSINRLFGNHAATECPGIWICRQKGKD